MIDLSNEYKATLDQRMRDRRMQMERQLDALQPLSFGTSLPLASVLCVMTVRDEMVRLPDTLRHIRSLGVARFAIIDNGSTDGTREYLLAQPEIDLFAMPMDFRGSAGGVGWASALIHRYYGPGRWVLVCDADEQLIYDGYQSHDLPTLAALLEQRGCLSMTAMMLEMYSASSVGCTVIRPGKQLLDCCPYFDGEGYAKRNCPAGASDGVPRVEWTGGPMVRCFGLENPWLAKTPFAFWSDETFYWHPHAIYPFEHNFCREGMPSGALLHFKYLSDFPSLAVRAYQRKQHANGARRYGVMAQRFLAEGDLCLMAAHSRRFESEQSLIEARLMSTILWTSD